MLSRAYYVGVPARERMTPGPGDIADSTFGLPVRYPLAPETMMLGRKRTALPRE